MYKSLKLILHIKRTLIKVVLEKKQNFSHSILLPCCPRLYSQHVPAVFTVADTPYSVSLLFGEANTDLWIWSLPSILTHISNRGKKGLIKYNNPQTFRDKLLLLFFFKQRHQ